MKSSSLFVPLLLGASAYAHGYLAAVTIAGQQYQGDEPGGTDNPSIIRLVSDIGPVKGSDNQDINCGLSAHSPAELVANANPGDVIAFDWRGGSTGGNNWPHNTGPMLTYMASCGSQSCNQFNSANAQWFKVQQAGKNSDGTWAQAALTQGATANVTLPSNIAPGNYLIRHEIISLQLAVSMGGAEFYPACAQLQVGGSGTGKPTASELVAFPGGYHDNDPGIYDPNVYEPGSSYTFPGPPIAAFVGVSAGGSGGNSGSSNTNNNNNNNGGGSGSSDNNSGGDSGSSDHNSGGDNSGSTGGSTGATPSSYGGANPASSSSAPSRCTLKRPPQPNNGGADNNTRRSLDDGSLNVKHYPKHISRVMRNLVFGGRSALRH